MLCIYTFEVNIMNIIVQLRPAQETEMKLKSNLCLGGLVHKIIRNVHIKSGGNYDIIVIKNR